MLARLISASQVILLCDTTRIYLFYRGRVYSRLTKHAGFSDLPRLRGQYYPIWALIDVDDQDSGPPIPCTSVIWPVQSSSLNLTRWKSWSKQSGASFLGMPQWNMEELT